MLVAMAACDTSTVVEWLVDGARSALAPGQMLTELSERLIGCGIPLWRVAVFVRTLHPQVMGRRFLWRPDTGASVAEAGHEAVEDEEYRTSPVVEVYRTGAALRRRLADANCTIDFPILAELRGEGVTDYLLSPTT